MNQLSSTLQKMALFVILLLTACTAAGGDQAAADIQPEYLPQTGDQAIIFTHHFNEGDYEEGTRIVIEGFSSAMQSSGQTRRTYFLESPETNEIVVISFFHPESSTEEWMASAEREEVLQRLRSLYREPLEVQQVIVEEVHDTD
jgi:heme-degrading monooxygenase HmoA